MNTDATELHMPLQCQAFACRDSRQSPLELLYKFARSQCRVGTTKAKRRATRHLVRGRPRPAAPPALAASRGDDTGDGADCQVAAVVARLRRAAAQSVGHTHRVGRVESMPIWPRSVGQKQNDATGRLQAEEEGGVVDATRRLCKSRSTPWSCC